MNSLHNIPDLFKKPKEDQSIENQYMVLRRTLYINWVILSKILHKNLTLSFSFNFILFHQIAYTQYNNQY